MQVTSDDYCINSAGATENSLGQRGLTVSELRYKPRPFQSVRPLELPHPNVCFDFADPGSAPGTQVPNHRAANSMLADPTTCTTIRHGLLLAVEPTAKVRAELCEDQPPASSAPVWHRESQGWSARRLREERFRRPCGPRSVSPPARPRPTKKRCRGRSRRASLEGTNLTYCHPRAETVRALTVQLGGSGAGTVRAFPPAISCKTAPAGLAWLDEPASDRLWATSRDGDVVLITTGDGAFQRE